MTEEIREAPPLPNRAISGLSAPQRLTSNASTDIGARAHVASRHSRLIADAPVALHYVSLASGLVLLLYLDRRLWFIGDIFEFFARMQPGHALNLLSPHNEHWSTIPILVNLGLYRAFGMHTYVPYLAVALAVHILIAHLLWRWMRRLGVDLWIATGLAAVFVVLGAGVENLTSSFQLGFLLPVALGLLGCFLVDHGNPGTKRDLGFWPIGIAATMCSGIGVSMVVLAAILVLLRRGWFAALPVASVPAFVYLVWLFTIAHGAASTTPAPKWELTLVPQYVWTGISTAVSDTTGLAGIGGVLVIAFAVWLYRERSLARTDLAFAFAGPFTALVFFALVGVGRVALGVNESEATRYAYTFDALIFPSVAVAITFFVRWTRAGRALVTVAIGVLAVDGLAGIESWLQVNEVVQVAARGEILAAATLVSNGTSLAVGADGKVEPVRSPDLTVAVLRSMIRAGKVPLTSTTPTDKLNAALFLQTSVTNRPTTSSTHRPRVGTDTRPLPAAAGDGCLIVANGTAPTQLRLFFESAGSVAITPGGTGSLGLQLSWASSPLALTSVFNTPINDGDRVYLNITAPATAPLLTLPPGVTTVCGVAV